MKFYRPIGRVRRVSVREGRLRYPLRAFSPTLPMGEYIGRLKARMIKHVGELSSATRQ